MTEKRFTMGYKVYRDNLTGERYDEVTESYKICHLLNELNDENEQLKSDVQMCREKALYWRNKAEDIFGDMKTNIELKQENEQLKEENEKYKQSNREAIKIFERYNRLLKELGYD